MSTFNYMGRNGNKWLHTPDVLLKGKVVFDVKILGDVEVEAVSGAEVVNTAVRKIKFNVDLLKSQGKELTKAQLAVCTDSVTVTDKKTKTVIHHFPLTKISFCGDDSSDVHVFTFIAKVTTDVKTHSPTVRHHCYAFISLGKKANKLTLTVGQAFDLCYQRFIMSDENDLSTVIDYKKKSVDLQRQVSSLQYENIVLKKSIERMERKGEEDLEKFCKKHQISGLESLLRKTSNSADSECHQDITDSEIQPESPQKVSMVGRRLENLILQPLGGDMDTVSGCDPLGANVDLKNTASVFPDDVFDKSFGSETGLPDHPFDTSPVNGSVFSCDPFANSPASGSAFPDDPFHNPMKIGSAFSDGLLDDAGENSSDCDPFGMPSFNLIGNSSNVVGCISVLHHLPDNEDFSKEVDINDNGEHPSI